MYMHEAPVHVCVRAGPAGQALGVHGQRRESMQGEARESAHLPERIPPTYTLPISASILPSRW